MSQPFQVLGCSREKELFADMLHSPQAHPAQSDLVLQRRKEYFYFPALALRCCEGRHGRPLARPLSRRFVDMDRDLPIVAPCALRFLRAIATALPRGRVHMRSDDVLPVILRKAFEIAGVPISK